jgi:cyclophilin family peptidyl-prolyl cis-trans isomerase
MRRSLLAALVLLLAGFGMVTAQDARTPAEICSAAVPADEPATREYAQAEQVLEPGIDYRAVLCTDAGPVYVDLFEDFAPITVNSFVFLAQNGYYNNTTFHRVIQDFMAQGGDPTGTGSGDPGYSFADEFVGFLNFDVPGWLAMANANRPEEGIVGTNGSQFFITTVPTPHLNLRHTIFGQVLEGQENVANIQLRDPATATEPGTALQTVVIITDPATVTTTFTEAAPATEDEIVAALGALDEMVPEGVEHPVTTQTTDEVVAGAPEAVQEDYRAFLNNHQHRFRVTSNISACNLEQLPFMTVTYTIDAFATREEATAALNDRFLGELATTEGLTETPTETLTQPMYTEATSACDTAATRAVTHWQRGQYLITAEAVIPTDSPATPDVWLSDIVGIRLYESILSDVLRRELRAAQGGESAPSATDEAATPES